MQYIAMFIIHWLLLVTLCVQEAYCQCSGSTLHVQLQMLKKEYIATPNFPSSNYSQNLTCVWCIDSSDVSSRILFKVRYVRTTNTMDILRIYKGPDDTGQPVVDSESDVSLQREVVNVITGSTLFVTFTTDDDSTNNGSGFELYILESQDFSGAPCTETIQLEAENTEKFITSPNFPNNYNTSISCSWNISNADNTEMLISVIYMDVEVDPTSPILKCYDSIQIGDSTELCAEKDMRSSYTYRSNDSVLVTFRSDAVQAKGGFALSYIKLSNIDSEITETTTSSVYLSTNNVDYTSPSEETTGKTYSVYSSMGGTTSLVSLSSNKQTTEILSTNYISTDGTGMVAQSSQTTSTDTDFKSTVSLATTTEKVELTTATSRQTATFISSNAPSTSSTEKTTTTSEQEETSTVKPETSTFNVTTQQESSTETSAQLKTMSLTTTLLEPTTEATHSETSIKDQTTPFLDTTTQKEITTSQNNQGSTVFIETKTTQINTTKDNAVLSPEAQAGIITGAVIGVAGVGLLLGASVYLVFQSLGGNPIKGKSASRKTNNIQITDDNMPRWIKMIETMKKSPYDPTYKN